MSTVIILLILIIIAFYAFKNSFQHFKGEGGCCGGGKCSAPMKMPKKTLKDPIVGSMQLNISGMHCQNCAVKLCNALNKIDGICANVVLENDLAIISFDRTIDTMELYSVVEDVGYKIVSIDQDM